MYQPPAAAATIAACLRAGIRPVLITGDHPGTARAVTTELGIVPAGVSVVDFCHRCKICSAPCQSTRRSWRS
jgi:P-type Ca2+ transporter type 2C